MAIRLLEQSIAAFAPQTALKRAQAHAALTYLWGGGYTGARHDRRALKDWSPNPQSAGADTIPDLPTLRARSSDLVRNAPLAKGAINTVATNVIGTGLVAHPQIDREVLGLSQDAAAAWNRRMKQLFSAVAKTPALDITGRMPFWRMQHVALRAPLERGDLLILRRTSTRRSALLQTTFQLIEADRVCNPQTEAERPGFMGGVETDLDGAVLRYHIASHHPDERLTRQPLTWQSVPAEGSATGDPLAWLVAWTTRPDEIRGVPYLATCIEALKQIERYGNAELMAAVVSAMFTVFIKSESDPLAANVVDPTVVGAPPQYALGNGAVGRLLPGEDVVQANPMRPNAAFQPFVQAWAEQIGVATEIPYEILLKHFQSSYSAARGAQLEAWRHFWQRREWIATEFCQPVYAAVVAEAVARGWVQAPGFFEDPFVRLAYTKASWVGPEPGQIDPRSEVEAAALRVEKGFSTMEDETAALTGGDFHDNIEKLRRERELMASIAPASNAPAPAQGVSPTLAPMPEAHDLDIPSAHRVALEVAEVASAVASSSILQALHDERAATDRARAAERRAAQTDRAAFVDALHDSLTAVAERPASAAPVAITVEAPRMGRRVMALTRNALGEITGGTMEEVA